MLKLFSSFKWKSIISKLFNLAPLPYSEKVGFKIANLLFILFISRYIISVAPLPGIISSLSTFM